MNDTVNHPSHYTSHPSGVECIEVTRHMTFNVGNAIKYLWRAGLKFTDTRGGGHSLDSHAGAASNAASLEDLNKSIWYLMDEVQRLGGVVTARSQPATPVRRLQPGEKYAASGEVHGGGHCFTADEHEVMAYALRTKGPFNHSDVFGDTSLSEDDILAALHHLENGGMVEQLGNTWRAI